MPYTILHWFCICLVYIPVHACISHFRWPMKLDILVFAVSQRAPKKAQSIAQPASGSTSYSHSTFISSAAQDVFRTQFSLRPILVEREVTLSET